LAPGLIGYLKEPGLCFAYRWRQGNADSLKDFAAGRGTGGADSKPAPLFFQLVTVDGHGPYHLNLFPELFDKDEE